MTLLLLGCAPSPLEGTYDLAVEDALSSCPAGDSMPWYSPASTGVELSVLEVTPGSSFAFAVDSESDTGTIPCEVDGGVFDCRFETSDTDPSDDEVIIGGVWLSATSGKAWWAMTRYCDSGYADEFDETLCVEPGTRNCAMTTHLSLTHSGEQ